MARILRLLSLFCLSSLTLLACDSSSPHLAPLDTGDTILAFGDSLTRGTGATDAESYPAVLAMLTGYDVVNAGIPGETSAFGLKRLPLMLDRHQPSLLILCHGGNDILRRQDRSRMKANITSMVRLAQQRGIDVLLIAVPDFGLFLDAAEEYREIAEATGVPLEEDIIPDILGKISLKADQIHPNADGYALLARTIHTRLMEDGAL